MSTGRKDCIPRTIQAFSEDQEREMNGWKPGNVQNKD
jgi:hypothetical protein